MSRIGPHTSIQTSIVVVLNPVLNVSTGRKEGRKEKGLCDGLSWALLLCPLSPFLTLPSKEKGKMEVSRTLSHATSCLHRGCLHVTLPGCLLSLITSNKGSMPFDIVYRALLPHWNTWAFIGHDAVLSQTIIKTTTIHLNGKVLDFTLLWWKHI